MRRRLDRRLTLAVMGDGWWRRCTLVCAFGRCSPDHPRIELEATCSATRAPLRANTCHGSAATSSRWTSAPGTQAVFESVPWVRHAVVRRVFPDPARGAPGRTPAGRAVDWRPDGNERLVNTLARCSTPISARSRTSCRSSRARRAFGADAADVPALAPASAAAGRSPVDAALSWPRLVAPGSTRPACHHRTRPRQRGSGGARTERFVRTLPQVTGASKTPLQ
jgi:hypothetical protein